MNRANPVAGYINMSNLCSRSSGSTVPAEYNDDLSYRHTGRDISCNLGSLNIAKMMDSPFRPLC